MPMTKYLTPAPGLFLNNIDARREEVQLTVYSWFAAPHEVRHAHASSDPGCTLLQTAVPVQGERKAWMGRLNNNYSCNLHCA